MIKFSRNKLINVVSTDAETLSVHGVLDDDIYSVELDVTYRLTDLKLISIEGKWHRYTTPDCPRSVPPLQEAVGMRFEEGLSQKIMKTVGRRSCRHFANLLIECFYSAKETAAIIQWEKARVDSPDLSFEDFSESISPKPTIKENAASTPIETAPSSTDVPYTETVGHPQNMNTPQAEGPIIDIHVHTSPASPCSSAATEKLIAEAKTIGLDGICLTDHNHVWSPKETDRLKQKHGFLILRGNEITTDQGDILVFGMDEDIQGIIRIEDLRKKVLSIGGVMIAAHPFRGFLTFSAGDLGLTPEKAMNRPLFKNVDAIEVLNGKVTEDENNFAARIAKGLHLPVTGGSDAHDIDEIGTYATRFTAPINHEVDLLAALQSGNYTPVTFRKEK